MAVAASMVLLPIFEQLPFRPVLETTWQAVLDRFPIDDSDWMLVVVGTWAVNVAVYWGYGFLLGVLDFWQPLWLRKYRVQGTKGEAQFSARKYVNTALWVMGCQLFVQLPWGMVLYRFFPDTLLTSVPSLPSLRSVLRDIVVFAVLEEIGFYYFHRMMHLPSFYQRFHKIHHEWTAPIAIVSFYNHPLEYLLVNLIPAAAGPFLCGSHLSLTWLWYTLATITSMQTHAGYHAPLSTSPIFHDFHHEKFNSCFGVLGVLDRLHGTDKAFIDSPNGAHHYYWLGLTPPWNAAGGDAGLKLELEKSDGRAASKAK